MRFATTKFRSTLVATSTIHSRSSMLIVRVFIMSVLSPTMHKHSLVDGFTFTPKSSSVLSSPPSLTSSSVPTSSLLLPLPSIHHHRLSSGTTTSPIRSTITSTSTSTQISLALDPTTPTTILESITTITRDQAEQLAGPFFGLSLFPYLLFLYFLSHPSNNTPKGITVGFTTCLLFVFLTIPAAIAAQVLYGVSLADCDWLHGSAESMLTITNLVTVVGFRQAFQGKELERRRQTTQERNDDIEIDIDIEIQPLLSVTSYQPMIVLVTILTFLAGLTALIPAIMSPEVHTPYLNGFMDLPYNSMKDIFGSVLNVQNEPENALTVGWYVL